VIATVPSETTMKTTLLPILAALALAGATPVMAQPATPAGTAHIVIVPGAFVDGSGWRAVHDILWLKGYKTSIVQPPLTAFDADVAATRKIIDAQGGPVVLVGHSYGGSVITVAGGRDKVKALVYVAGFQPDIGESSALLAGSMPAASNSLMPGLDGVVFFDPVKFHADFAADLTTNRTNFMSVAQKPITTAAFGARNYEAAWRKKPSYGIVATEDRALNPELQRWMYKRAGSKVTEVKASHVVYLSQPEAVAAVIEQAALNVKK
jgi:pimeloyl-ACP methyl ester carboxylesterase